MYDSIRSQSGFGDTENDETSGDLWVLHLEYATCDGHGKYP
jgi:hypothetical protein